MVLICFVTWPGTCYAEDAAKWDFYSSDHVSGLPILHYNHGDFCDHIISVTTPRLFAKVPSQTAVFRILVTVPDLLL